jgi:type IV secretion system protein VirB2
MVQSRGRPRRDADGGSGPIPAIAHSLLAALVALSFPAAAAAQSYGDPRGSGPILAAVMWVQGTLLGNVATAVAVVAIAVVGFLMLTGRLEWRRGITVILGCFIIFGAAAIVSGIQSAAQMSG